MTDRELLAVMSEMFDAKFDSKLKAELQPLKNDIKNMEEHLSADILGMDSKIEKLDERMRRIEGKVSGLEEKTTKLDEKMHNLRQDMRDMEHGVRSEIKELRGGLHDIKLRLENVTDKNIQLLAEDIIKIMKARLNHYSDIHRGNLLVKFYMEMLTERKRCGKLLFA